MRYKDLELKTFANAAAFAAWLADNYDQAQGIWLRFFKKASGKQTFSYAEALDVALCYGWIDTMANKYDDESYLQKFTPRRKQSIWSKRNIEHVARLTTAGRMQPPGQAAIDAAKADGRWQRAYEAPTEMKIPADFMAELTKNPQALAFFKTLNKANTYAIYWRLATAKKPETRVKRMQVLLAMMAKGEKLH